MKRWIQGRDAAKAESERAAAQADQLRRLADEVERGQVKYLVVTVIRPDGRVERLGDTGAMAKP